MPETTQTYLTIHDQRQVFGELSFLLSTLPMREKFLYQYGAFVAGAIAIPATVIFWRCGFRAFNLYKYNKFRLATLVISMSAPVNFGFFHEVIVTQRLQDFFRPEEALYYGFKSLIASQFGLCCCVGLSSMATFYCAQRIGIIPVPDLFYKKESRAYTIDFYKTKMRPYAKTIVMTWAMASALMFVVGLAEYHQSKTLLAKINRKTLSSKEN